MSAADAVTQRGLRDAQQGADSFDLVHAPILAPLVYRYQQRRLLLAMSGANTLRAMADNKRGKVSDLNREESAKLRAIWDAIPNKPSQAAFGEQYGIGSQAAVGLFLSRKAAISLKAARGFAEGLRCDISAFSPRLAKEAADLGKASGAMSDEIDMTALSRMELQLLMLYRGLSSDQKDELMQHVNNLFIQAHPERSSANPFGNKVLQKASTPKTMA